MRVVHLLLVGALACGDPGVPAPDADPRSDGAATDSGQPPRDAGRPPNDAGERDAGRSSPGWRREASLPVAVQELAVASDGEGIWIAGGLEVPLYAPVQTVRRLRTGGGWSEAPALPAPRHHGSLVHLDGDLYAFGGMETLEFDERRTAWVLRAGAERWTEIADMPQGRGAAVARAIGGRIYLAAGTSDGRGGCPLVEPVWAYDPDGDAWDATLAPIPTPREHAAGLVHDGRLWVLGGRRCGTDSNVAAVEIYDPGSDTWSAGPALPSPRGGFGASVLDGVIYAVGGETSEMVPALDTVDALDLSTMTWSAAPPVPTRRHGHDVVTAGGRIWVVGGADVRLAGAVDAVESYAP